MSLWCSAEMHEEDRTTQCGLRAGHGEGPVVVHEWPGERYKDAAMPLDTTTVTWRGPRDQRTGEERRHDAAYNHPQHYGGEDNPYETIKVLCHWLTPEQIQGFTLGNAIKYISRAGKKDPAKTIEDLKKARWYLDYEVTRLDVLGTEAALDNGG